MGQVGLLPHKASGWPLCRFLKTLHKNLCCVSEDKLWQPFCGWLDLLWQLFSGYIFHTMSELQRLKKVEDSSFKELRVAPSILSLQQVCKVAEVDGESLV